MKRDNYSTKQTFDIEKTIVTRTPLAHNIILKENVIYIFKKL